MRKKIDDGGFEPPYRLQAMEPMFGQIKDLTGTQLPPVPVADVEKVRAAGLDPHHSQRPPKPRIVQQKPVATPIQTRC
ncbi:MAG TPA: hypothetical protein VFJ59_13610 [Pseudolabrys sp.]|nr:hypothetical protein [Pseudolabrys sp.]